MVKEMSEISSMFKKGASCTVVINKSADSSMNKGTKNNRNPFLGRVTLRKTYSGYALGVDYPNTLKAIAERMGSNAEPNLKKNWHKPVEGELGRWFSTDRKTESKYYLKLGRNVNQIAYKVVTEYFLDGRKATEDEVYLIKSWESKSSHTQSSTQVEMGIDKDHEQKFILPALESVTLIKQGNKVWTPCKVKVSTIEVETPSYVVSRR